MGRRSPPDRPVSPFDDFASRYGSARRRGMFAQALREIGALIVDGVFPPGATLPRETDLIARLRISRTTLREAMKSLAAKGLIEIGPRTGTRVRDRSEWHHTDPDVMVWHYEAGPAADFLDSLSDLRRVLEPAAAARAASRATRPELATIAAAYQRMGETIGDPKAHGAADCDFHTAIFAATHNPMLARLVDSIVIGIYANTVVASPGVVEGQRRSLPYHAAILDAIRARDPTAAAAAAERLLDSWHPVPERVRLALERRKPPQPSTQGVRGDSTRRPNADH